MGGGEGREEYRKDDLVGSLTNFLSCCKDGGREPRRGRGLETPALGSIAKA